MGGGNGSVVDARMLGTCNGVQLLPVSRRREGLAYDTTRSFLHGGNDVGPGPKELA